MGAQAKKKGDPNHDSEARESEAPVHKVFLDAFRLARYPVTVEQYRKFVEDDGYAEERWWQAGGFGKFTQPDGWEDQLQYPSRPVVNVSWYEAAAYCQWAGFLLPTEAEWERAARGTDARRYPWGNINVDSSRLNYDKSGIGHPTPVGIYPLGATPEGVYDLAGNVREWCADWYGPYPANAVANPYGYASDRVFRGGGWRLPAGYCRAAYRSGLGPTRRYDSLGFRVAPVPSGKQAGSGRQQRTEPGV